MGFFDKLFGKDKKNEIKSEEALDSAVQNTKEDADSEVNINDVNENVQDCVSAEAPEQNDENDKAENAVTNESKTASNIASNIAREKVTAAFEMFPVKKESVSPERINAICVKFINEALTMGQELKNSDLVGLSYQELCVLYNNMQMMKIKLDPKIQAIAGVVIENNLKVTRARLLWALKQCPLYTLYSRINGLPFSSNASLFLFTDKDLAESQLKESDIKYLALKEIPQEQQEMHFDLFYITGFKEAIIDSGVKIPFTDLYTAKKPEVYGTINPDLRSRMIFFSQMVESTRLKVEAESRKHTEEELRNINRVWADITEGLIRTSLLLPAELADDGKSIRCKGISVKDPQGKCWLAMFTDQIALNGFFKSEQTAASVKNAILSQYNVIKEKAEFEGIIINPGRESFKIPSKILASRREIKKEDADKEQAE